MVNSNPNGKRPRDEDNSGRNDEAEFTSFCPETKIIRVNSSSSIISDASSGGSAARVNPLVSDEFDIDSVEARKIQEDLLNILDDSEAVTERDPAIQGLESVIKSFEEEIQVPAPPAFAPPVETASASGESSPSSQPELGYLLEASDDELGLPPSDNNGGVTEERKMDAADFTASPPAATLDGIGFENDIIPSYDAFDFGMGSYSESNNFGGEYAALGGLFEYSDGGASEMPWRTESLSAL